MRKLLKYGRIYGDQDPKLTEADIFQMKIAVPEFTVENLVKVSGQDNILNNLTLIASGQVNGQVSGQVTDSKISILTSCLEAKKSSELMLLTEIKHRETFYRHYLFLCEKVLYDFFT